MVNSSQQKFQFLREQEERSILVKIKFKLYEISTEVLLEVFSTCGNIETIENFRSGEEFHSRVCFQDKDSAIRALNWYNGRCIYDFWCELELFQGFQVTNRSGKTEVPAQETKEVPTEEDDAQIIRNSPRCVDQKFKVFSDIILGDSKSELSDIQGFSNEPSAIEAFANSIKDVRTEISFNPSELDASREDDDESSAPEIEEIEAPMTEEKRMEGPFADGQQESKSSLNAPEPSPFLMSRAGVVLGVELKELEFVKPSCAPANLRQGYSDPTIPWGISAERSQKINLEWLSEFLSWPQLENETQRQAFQMQSGFSEVITYPLAVVVLEELDEMDILQGRIAVLTENSDAYKLFVEMLVIDVEPFQEMDVVIGKPRMVERNLIFDPGISVLVTRMGYRNEIIGLFLDLKLLRNILKSFPFDGGGVIACLVEVKVDGRPRLSDAIVVVGKLFQSVNSCCWCGAERMGLYWLPDCILTFDPGGDGSAFRRMRQQMQVLVSLVMSC